MALASNFKTTAPATPGKSRWGGIKSAQPRSPMLNIGHEYDVELVSLEETRNPGTGSESYKVTVKVIDSDDDRIRAGSEAVIIYSKGGRAREAGDAKLKATVVAFAGFSPGPEGDEQYDAVDPTGELIDNTFNGVGSNFLGEKAHVTVLDGGPVKDKKSGAETGDRYREPKWTPIAAA